MEETGSLTLDELYTAANDMCRKHWNVEFTGTIEIVNYEWSGTNGQYRSKRDDPTYQIIRMSRKTNAKRTRTEVLGTLLHEIVHWRLHTTGQPYKDVNNPFIAECLRVGAPISKTGPAQNAYKRYLSIKNYEERTGLKYGEEALV